MNRLWRCVWLCAALLGLSHAEQDCGTPPEDVESLQDGILYDREVTAQSHNYYVIHLGPLNVQANPKPLTISLTRFGSGDPDLFVSWTRGYCRHETDGFDRAARRLGDDSYTLTVDELTEAASRPNPCGNAIYLAVQGWGQSTNYTIGFHYNEALSLDCGLPQAGHALPTGTNYYLTPARTADADELSITITPLEGTPHVVITLPPVGGAAGLITREADVAHSMTMRIRQTEANGNANQRFPAEGEQLKIAISAPDGEEVQYRVLYTWGAAGTVDAVACPIYLTSGIAQAEHLEPGEWEYFQIEFEDAQCTLDITATKFSGDPNLFVSYPGSEFTHPSEEHHDAKSEREGSDHIRVGGGCTRDGIADSFAANGTYYIGVHVDAGSSPADFTLLAEVVCANDDDRGASTIVLQNGQPQHSALSRHCHRIYRFEVGRSSSGEHTDIDISLTREHGDPDLYVHGYRWNQSEPLRAPSVSAKNGHYDFVSLSFGDDNLRLNQERLRAIGCDQAEMHLPSADPTQPEDTCIIEVYVYAFTSTEYSLTATTSDHVSLLRDGVPMADYLQRNQVEHFQYRMEANAAGEYSSIAISLTDNAGGDPDLFVLVMNDPDNPEQLAGHDHRDFFSRTTRSDGVQISKEKVQEYCEAWVAAGNSDCPDLSIAVEGYQDTRFTILVTQVADVLLVDGIPQEMTLPAYELQDNYYFQVQQIQSVNGGVTFHPTIVLNAESNTLGGNFRLLVSTSGVTPDSRNQETIDYSSQWSSHPSPILIRPTDAGYCKKNITTDTATYCEYHVSVFSHIWTHAAQAGENASYTIAFTTRRFARELRLTEPLQDVLPGNEYAHFSLSLTEEEATHARVLRVQVTTLGGDPDLYAVARLPNATCYNRDANEDDTINEACFPDIHHSDYHARAVGTDMIEIPNPQYETTYFISVYAYHELAQFSIVASLSFNSENCPAEAPEASSRTDCPEPGSTRDECEASGCCWLLDTDTLPENPTEVSCLTDAEPDFSVLLDGQPQQGEVPIGGVRYYKLTVPELRNGQPTLILSVTQEQGAIRAFVNLPGVSGDVWPSEFNYDYDITSFLASEGRLEQVAAGEYRIAVYTDTEMDIGSAIYSITITSANSYQTLREGVPVTGALGYHQVARYMLTVGGADDDTAETKPTIHITVTPLSGDPDLYVSYHLFDYDGLPADQVLNYGWPTPQSHHYDMKAEAYYDDTIVIPPEDVEIYCPDTVEWDGHTFEDGSSSPSGCHYWITVYGFSACTYSITASYNTPVSLSPGTPLQGGIEPSDTMHYEFFPPLVAAGESYVMQLTFTPRTPGSEPWVFLNTANATECTVRGAGSCLPHQQPSDSGLCHGFRRATHAVCWGPKKAHYERISEPLTMTISSDDPELGGCYFDAEHDFCRFTVAVFGGLAETANHHHRVNVSVVDFTLLVQDQGTVVTLQNDIPLQVDIANHTTNSKRHFIIEVPECTADDPCTVDIVLTPLNILSDPDLAVAHCADLPGAICPFPSPYAYGAPIPTCRTGAGSAEAADCWQEDVKTSIYGHGRADVVTYTNVGSDSDNQIRPDLFTISVVSWSDGGYTLLAHVSHATTTHVVFLQPGVPQVGVLSGHPDGDQTAFLRERVRYYSILEPQRLHSLTITVESDGINAPLMMCVKHMRITDFNSSLPSTPMPFDHSPGSGPHDLSEGVCDYVSLASTHPPPLEISTDDTCVSDPAKPSSFDGVPLCNIIVAVDSAWTGDEHASVTGQTFTISYSLSSAPRTLQIGKSVRDVTIAGEWDYFKVSVPYSERPEDKSLLVQVTPFGGDPDLYMAPIPKDGIPYSLDTIVNTVMNSTSAFEKQQWFRDNGQQANLVGGDSITFGYDSSVDYLIGVHAFYTGDTQFSIVASVVHTGNCEGRDCVDSTLLYDGQPQQGAHTAESDYTRHYTFEYDAQVDGLTTAGDVLLSLEDVEGENMVFIKFFCAYDDIACNNATRVFPESQEDVENCPANECYSFSSELRETFRIRSPKSGTWGITLKSITRTDEETFTITITAQDSYTTLRDGQAVQGELDQGEYGRYLITITDPDKDIHIVVTPRSGDPDLLVGYNLIPATRYGWPDKHHFDMKAENYFDDAVIIPHGDATFCPNGIDAVGGCHYFISVYAFSACTYTIVASYSRPQMLRPGSPQQGYISPSDIAYFEIETPRTHLYEMELTLTALRGSPQVYVYAGSSKHVHGEDIPCEDLPGGCEPHVNTTKPGCNTYSAYSRESCWVPTVPKMWHLRDTSMPLRISSNDTGACVYSRASSCKYVVAVWGGSGEDATHHRVNITRVSYTIGYTTTNHTIALLPGIAQRVDLLATGEYVEFTFAVSTATDHVDFVLTPISGDPDLYVAQCADSSCIYPTQATAQHSSGWADNGWISAKSSRSVTVDYARFESVEPGRFLISVESYRQSAFTIQAVVSSDRRTDFSPLQLGIPQVGVLSANDDHRYYAVDVFSEEGIEVTISLVALVGDPDLSVLQATDECLCCTAEYDFGELNSGDGGGDWAGDPHCGGDGARCAHQADLENYVLNTCMPEDTAPNLNVSRAVGNDFVVFNGVRDARFLIRVKPNGRTVYSITASTDTSILLTPFAAHQDRIAQDDIHYFKIDLTHVDPDASLEVSVTSFEGDPDLYISDVYRHPNDTVGDCRWYDHPNGVNDPNPDCYYANSYHDDAITISYDRLVRTPLTNGLRLWYVGLHAFEPSRYSIAMRFNGPQILSAEGVPKTGKVGFASVQMYTLIVEQGKTYSISLSVPRGTAYLYASNAAEVHTSELCPHVPGVPPSTCNAPPGGEIKKSENTFLDGDHVQEITLNTDMYPPAASTCTGDFCTYWVWVYGIVRDDACKLGANDYLCTEYTITAIDPHDGDWKLQNHIPVERSLEEDSTHYYFYEANVPEGKAVVLTIQLTVTDSSDPDIYLSDGLGEGTQKSPDHPNPETCRTVYPEPPKCTLSRSAGADFLVEQMNRAGKHYWYIGVHAYGQSSSYTILVSSEIASVADNQPVRLTAGVPQKGVFSGELRKRTYFASLSCPDASECGTGVSPSEVKCRHDAARCHAGLNSVRVSTNKLRGEQVEFYVKAFGLNATDNPFTNSKTYNGNTINPENSSTYDISSVDSGSHHLFHKFDECLGPVGCTIIVLVRDETEEEDRSDQNIDVFSVSVSTDAQIPYVEPGNPVTGVHVWRDDYAYFRVKVTDTRSALQLSLTSLSGDPDMYVTFHNPSGDEPMLVPNVEAENRCTSADEITSSCVWLSDKLGGEVVTIPRPRRGEYVIGVTTWSSDAVFTLMASAGVHTLVADQPQSDSISAGDSNLFVYSVDTSDECKDLSPRACGLAHACEIGPQSEGSKCQLRPARLAISVESGEVSFLAVTGDIIYSLQAQTHETSAIKEKMNRNDLADCINDIDAAKCLDSTDAMNPSVTENSAILASTTCDDHRERSGACLYYIRVDAVVDSIFTVRISRGGHSSQLNLGAIIPAQHLDQGQVDFYQVHPARGHPLNIRVTSVYGSVFTLVSVDRAIPKPTIEGCQYENRLIEGTHDREYFQADPENPKCYPLSFPFKGSGIATVPQSVVDGLFPDDPSSPPPTFYVGIKATPAGAADFSIASYADAVRLNMGDTQNIDLKGGDLGAVFYFTTPEGVDNIVLDLGAQFLASEELSDKGCVPPKLVNVQILTDKMVDRSGCVNVPTDGTGAPAPCLYDADIPKHSVFDTVSKLQIVENQIQINPGQTVMLEDIETELHCQDCTYFVRVSSEKPLQLKAAITAGSQRQSILLADAEKTQCVLHKSGELKGETFEQLVSDMTWDQIAENFHPSGEEVADYKERLQSWPYNKKLPISTVNDVDTVEKNTLVAIREPLFFSLAMDPSTQQFSVFVEQCIGNTDLYLSPAGEKSEDGEAANTLYPNPDEHTSTVSGTGLLELNYKSVRAAGVPAYSRYALGIASHGKSSTQSKFKVYAIRNYEQPMHAAEQDSHVSVAQEGDGLKIQFQSAVINQKSNLLATKTGKDIIYTLEYILESDALKMNSDYTFNNIHLDTVCGLKYLEGTAKTQILSPDTVTDGGTILVGTVPQMGLKKGSKYYLNIRASIPETDIITHDLFYETVEFTVRTDAAPDNGSTKTLQLALGIGLPALVLAIIIVVYLTVRNRRLTQELEIEMHDVPKAAVRKAVGSTYGRQNKQKSYSPLLVDDFADDDVEDGSYLAPIDDDAIAAANATPDANGVDEKDAADDSTAI